MLSKEQADKLAGFIDAVKFATSEKTRAASDFRATEANLATAQLRLDNIMAELQRGPVAPVKRPYNRKGNAGQQSLSGIPDKSGDPQ